MAQQLKNRLGYLDPKSTLFLLCDVQERFRPVMRHFEGIIKNTHKLLSAGQILEVALIASEQYPEKLGRTVPELDVKHAIGVYPKTSFSMLADPDISAAVKLSTPSTALQSVVLFGLESHVCVEQTAMDLLCMNLSVHIVADCTISRSDEDRHLAFERLKQIGCHITTSENVIFKLMRDKNHPKFNDIRKLVSEPTTDTGLSKL